MSFGLSARWKLHFFACIALFVNYYLYDIPAALYRPLQALLVVSSTKESESPILQASSEAAAVNGTSSNGIYFLPSVPAPVFPMRIEDFPFYMNLLYTLYSISNILLPLVSGWLMDRSEYLRGILKHKETPRGSVKREEPFTPSEWKGRSVGKQSPAILSVNNGENQTRLLESRSSADNSIPPLNLPDSSVGHQLDKVSLFIARVPWLNVFSLLVLLGQVMFLLGLFWQNYWLMALGRFTFGLGGESVGVATSRSISIWFQGKELAMALGIYLSVGRLGTVMNNLITPWLALHFGSFVAGSAGVGLGIVALFATQYISENSDLGDLMAKQVGDVGADKKSSNPTQLQDQSNVSLWQSVQLEVKMMSRQVHRAFWLLCLVAFFLYGVMVPFSTMASDFLQLQGYSSISAGYIMSIPDTIALFIVPVLGSFVDRHGFAITFLIWSGIFITVAHTSLALGNSPMITFISLGFGYSGLFTIWTCIPCLAPISYLTTAYGLATASSNCGFALIPMIMAVVLTSSGKDYVKAELSLAFLSALGVLFATWLYLDNQRFYLHLDSQNLSESAGKTEDLELLYLTSPESKKLVDGEDVKAKGN